MGERTMLTMLTGHQPGNDQQGKYTATLGPRFSAHPDLVPPDLVTKTLSPEDVTKSGSDCAYKRSGGMSPSPYFVMMHPPPPKRRCFTNEHINLKL
eukprot:sb/3479180/